MHLCQLATLPPGAGPRHPCGGEIEVSTAACTRRQCKLEILCNELLGTRKSTCQISIYDMHGTRVIIDLQRLPVLEGKGEPSFTWYVSMLNPQGELGWNIRGMIVWQMRSVVGSILLCTIHVMWSYVNSCLSNEVPIFLIC